MNDLSTVISCDSVESFGGYLNRLFQTLSVEDRRKANAMFSGHLVKYGFEGSFERMNGRSIQELIDSGVSIAKPVAEGELEGHCFKLFGSPDESKEAKQ